MVKDEFWKFFMEYAHNYLWDINQWKDFETRFMISGFLHFNDTKKITRTKEGYKAFFDTIFLDLDKIKELESITKEELSNNKRLNIHLSEAKKSKKRQLLDFLFAITTGIVTYFYLDWKWVFIFVGIYAYLKASFVYSILEKTGNVRTQMSEAELAEVEKLDPLTRKKRIEAYNRGYVVSQGCLQFILSLAILGGFASLARNLTSLIF